MHLNKVVAQLPFIMDKYLQNSFMRSHGLHLLLTFNLFLMRPSAAGQTLTNVAIPISLFCLFLSIYLSKDTNLSKSREHYIFERFVLFAIFYSYTITTGLISGMGNLDFSIKELVAVLIIFGCYSYCLKSNIEAKRFFDTFCITMSVLGISSGISYAIGLFYDVNSIAIAHVSVKGYEDLVSHNDASGLVVFPFTLIYGVYTLGDEVTLRSSLFFREAGIGQAFSVFSLLYALQNKMKLWILIGCIVGLICAFSTAGYIVLMLCSMLYWLNRRAITISRVLIFIISAIVGVLIVLYLPDYGLFDKSLTHAESITDRTYAAEYSISEFLNNPFGLGLFSQVFANQGISLIGQLSAIGFIGFAIQMCAFLGLSFVDIANNSKRAVLLMPIFFTALLSQPLMGSPGVYVMSLVYIGMSSKFDDLK